MGLSKYAERWVFYLLNRQLKCVTQQQLICKPSSTSKSNEILPKTACEVINIMEIKHTLNKLSKVRNAYSETQHTPIKNKFSIDTKFNQRFYDYNKTQNSTRTHQITHSSATTFNSGVFLKE